MAAYPFRMRRPGRVRPVRLVVTAMALLVLAAGVLFSAGSAHHRHAPHTAADAGHPHPHPHAAGAEAGLPVTGLLHTHTAGAGEGVPRAGGPERGHRTVETPAHGHQHGNEWTPNLTPRVRLDVDTTLAGALVTRPGPLGRGRRAAGSGVAARNASLSLLGVLRV